VKVIDVMDESLEYIRYPEYFFPITIFCVGGAMMAMSLDSLMSGKAFKLWQPLGVIGGVGLVIWSMTQFYVLNLNRR